MSATERAPEGLRAPGKRLWTSVTNAYVLDEHERSILVEAVRTVDALDLLDAKTRTEGPVVQTPQGPRANPALVESRQQRIALARLLAVLGLPFGETTANKRGGARGTYGIRGAVK